MKDNELTPIEGAKAVSKFINKIGIILLGDYVVTLGESFNVEDVIEFQNFIDNLSSAKNETEFITIYNDSSYSFKLVYDTLVKNSKLVKGV